MKVKRGFSIGEVLLAMFILLIGIVDAVFLTVRSIGDITDSRAAVVATLLAQEGVELVRNVRDNTVTEVCGGTRCTSFSTSPYDLPGGSGGTCVIDYDTSAGESSLVCGSSGDGRLYRDSSGGGIGLFQHGTTGEPTEFYRKIYIQYSAADETIDEDDDTIALVTSVVVFGGKTNVPEANDVATECKISQHCVFAQTRLTSWINYGD